MKSNIKYFCYLAFIIFAFVLIPRGVRANEDGGTWENVSKGNNTKRLTTDNSVLNNYLDSIPVTENTNQKSANTYGLRYDISHFEIKENNTLQITGWALIKDYNNGIRGKFAPIYYLSISDEYNNEVIYKYEANKDNNGITFPELNVNNNGSIGYKYDDNICGTEKNSSGVYISKKYDNAEFAFDNIDLNYFTEKNKNNTINLHISLKIVIDNDYSIAECSKVASDWFEMGVTDVGSSNTNSTNKVMNKSNNIVDISYTNRVNLVATMTDFSGKCHDNPCNKNEYPKYTITEIEDDIKGAYANKYIYIFEEKPGKAKSAWTQAVDPIIITIKNDGDLCEDRNYAINNQEACCGSGKTTDSSICCAGEYGWKHSNEHPGACCNELPETCCDNKSYIDTNWNSKYAQTWYSGICCSNSKLKKTYGGKIYEFNTFKTAGMNNYYNEKCTVLYGNNKICTKPTNNVSAKSGTTDSFTVNGKGRKDNITKEIILSNPKSGITINEDNVSYIISSSQNGVDLSKTKITLNSVHYDVSLKKVTINYKFEYDYTSNNNSVNLNFDFSICYEKNDGIENNKCSSANYRKYNKAYCCSLNESYPDLDCNSIPDYKPADNGSLSCSNNISNLTNSPNTLGQEIKTYNDKGISGSRIKCYEKLIYKISNNQTQNNFSANSIYAGTGFKYDLTVIDEVTCSASYTNIRKYSSSNGADNATNDANRGLKDALNTILKTSNPEIYLTLDSNDTFTNSNNTNNKKYNIISSNDNKGDPSEYSNYSIPYADTCVSRTSIGITTYPCTKYINKSLPNKITGTITYNMELGKTFINRYTYKQSNTGGNNYIDGGNKFYTQIDDATGYHDFYIRVKKAGVSGKLNSSNINNFTCQYKVENILTTGEKIGTLDNGTNDRYLTRSISLSKAFNTAPSTNGRATNWKKYYVNDSSTKYITTTQSLIDTKPMYEFTLTPNDISNIQKYNKNNNYNVWSFENYETNNNNSSDIKNYRVSSFISCMLGKTTSGNTPTNCDSNIPNNSDGANKFNGGINNNAQGITNRFDKTGDWE